MLSVSHLCRCASSFKAAQSKLVVSNARNVFNNTNAVSRHLVTPARYSNTHKLDSLKGFRLSNIIKSNGIIVRLCSTSPKPKTPKAVGYWLLGCSGMVFTAVVLGMVAGYLILLYSIYYVVNLIVGTTNGSK